MTIDVKANLAIARKTILPDCEDMEDVYKIEKVLMKLVQEKIEEKGWTQKDFAIAAFEGDRGKPDDKYGKLKRGAQRIKLADIHNMAKALEIDPVYLFFDAYAAYRAGKYKEIAEEKPLPENSPNSANLAS